MQAEFWWGERREGSACSRHKCEIFKQGDGEVQTGLIWLKIGTGRRLL